jgi:hypothetical protein
MATVIVIKKGGKDEHQYLPVNLDRHPWRELSAVLQVEKIGVVGGPPALRHLLNTDLPQCDLWMGGVEPLKAGGYRDTGEWVFRIPVTLLDKIPLAAYVRGVQRANRGASRLHEAVKTYYEHLVVEKGSTEVPKPKTKPRGRDKKSKGGAGAFTVKAKTIYWSTLDGQHGTLIDLANQRVALAPWTTLCRKAMDDAYTQACPHVTARQIQAFVAGRQRIYGKKSSTENTKGDDV